MRLPSILPSWARLTRLLLLLAGPVPALAQTVDPAYRADYEAAFRATYDNPSDIPAAMTFAKVATLAGDLEGAIGALERVLIFNPDLPEVDLALGELYAALGAHTMARVYLDRVDPARLSPEERATRERVLAESTSAASRHRLSGTFASGLRYQTNANAGAVAAARVAGGTGQDFGAINPKADTNAFATLQANHSVDLDDDIGTRWDSRALLYGTRQFKRHSLNVSMIDLDTGPRFRLGDSLADGLTLKPYVMGNVFFLGGTEYFSSAGGGLNSTFRITPELAGDVTFDARSVIYNNSSEQPTATNKDAQQVQGRLQLLYTPTESDLIALLVQPTSYNARVGYETFKEVIVSTSYIRRFDAPWKLTELPWTVSVTAAHVSRWYQAKDMSIDTLHRRTDDEWDLGGALTIPLWNQIDFRFEVQQVWANSNVELYHYRNTAVIGGLEIRF